MKPYFVPLKKEYYIKFEDGSQNCEIRPSKHRGWNDKNIYPGRDLLLSCGYGKHRRLKKRIVKTVTAIGDLNPVFIPQWHIDAVEAIYGKRESWLIAYV